MKASVFNHFLTNLTAPFQLENQGQTVEDEQLTFLKTVEKARRDWLEAKEFFQFVTDPDLVDHAIHAIDAAEKKYMYLLKKARQEGIREGGFVDGD